MRATLTAAVALSALESVSGVAAADWEHTLATHMWGASISGDASFRDVSAEVDVPIDDILDALEFSGFAAYRARTEGWALGGEVIYLGLGNSNDTGDADMDQWIVDLDGGWRFHKNLELVFGLRYLRTNTTVEFSGPLAAELEGSTDRVDPIVGIRALVPFAKKWRFQGRADVGGFGVDSDLTWQAMVHLGIQASDTLAFWLGYRAIGYDVDLERERDALGLDLTFHGPQLGLTFHWE
jgi:opacity protein-like surface antigen